jgi:hypothetical protein
MKFVGWPQCYYLNVIKYLSSTLSLIEFIKFLNITVAGHEFNVPLKLKNSEVSRVLRRDAALLGLRFSLFWETVIPLRLILITTHYHVLEDCENPKCRYNTSGGSIFFIRLPSILWDTRDENFCLFAVNRAVTSASVRSYCTESAWRPMWYAEK